MKFLFALSLMVVLNVRAEEYGRGIPIIESGSYMTLIARNTSLTEMYGPTGIFDNFQPAVRTAHLGKIQQTNVDTGEANSSSSDSFDQGEAASDVVSVFIDDSGKHQVNIGSAESSVSVRCVGSTPVRTISTSVSDVMVNGTPVTVTGKPNQKVTFGTQGVLILNEQIVTRERGVIQVIANGARYYSTVKSIVVPVAHSEVHANCN